MNSRERWLALLQGKTADKVPMDYWATEEATQKFLRHFDLDSIFELYEEFDLDPLISLTPDYRGPTINGEKPIVPEGLGLYPEFPLESGRKEDFLGVKYKKSEYQGGVYWEPIHHPLAEFKSVKEIEENYDRWPKTEWFDYSGTKKKVEKYRDYPLMGGGSEPFLTYRYLRGREQAFKDLILNQEMVKFVLDKLFGFCRRNTERILGEGHGEITLSAVAEDLGAQTNLLYSRDQIKEFFLPHMSEMADLIHRCDAYVFCHSDGAIRKIIPDLIEIGIDVLNPIQWRSTGMDRKKLSEDFGEQVVFHGGVDNQFTLPFGSSEEVRQEVRENIQTLGKDGTYILAPCHNMQVNTPPENVMAMYEEGLNCGKR